MQFSINKNEGFFAGGLLLVIVVSVSAIFNYWAVACFSSAIFVATLIVYVSFLAKCAFSSGSWPSVPSDRVHAYVEEEVSRGQDHDTSSYSMKVSYGYSVGTEHYIGDRFRFPFGIAISVDDMRKCARKLNFKSGVAVYYDPRSPGTSTLVRGLSVLDALALVMFYVVSLLLLIGLVYLGVINA